MIQVFFFFVNDSAISLVCLCLWMLTMSWGSSVLNHSTETDEKGKHFGLGRLGELLKGRKHGESYGSLPLQR